MRIVDRNATYGTKISENIWKDNNGQLICNNCVLARTGAYDYRESDILQNGDYNKIVKVYRNDEDVFDPVSIASFENKPLCNDHPDDDVCTKNYKTLQYGFLRDVHRGSGEYANCLLGTLVVLDPEIISLIVSGEKRELSLGYDTEIVQGQDGKYYMKHIRGNHIALVDSGRAGCATIRDKNNINEIGGKGMKFRTGNVKISQELRRKLFDSTDEDTVVEVKEEVDDNGDTVLVPCEEETVTVEEVNDDEEVVPVEEVSNDSSDISSQLDTIIDLLSQLLNKFDIVSDGVEIGDDDVTELEEITEQPVEEVVPETTGETPKQPAETAQPTVEIQPVVEIKEPIVKVEGQPDAPVETETVEETVEADTDNVFYDADEDMYDEDDMDMNDEDMDEDVPVKDSKSSPYASLVRNRDAGIKQQSFQEIWQKRYDTKLKESR